MVQPLTFVLIAVPLLAVIVIQRQEINRLERERNTWKATAENQHARLKRERIIFNERLAAATRLWRDAVNGRDAAHNALRDLIQLAQVSFDGDPYYAEQSDLDGDAILSRARALVRADAPRETEA